MERAAVRALVSSLTGDPDTLDSAGVVWGTGGTALNCQVDGTTRRAASAEPENAAIAF